MILPDEYFGMTQIPKIPTCIQNLPRPTKHARFTETSSLGNDRFYGRIYEYESEPTIGLVGDEANEFVRVINKNFNYLLEIVGKQTLETIAMENLQEYIQLNWTIWREDFSQSNTIKVGGISIPDNVLQFLSLNSELLKFLEFMRIVDKFFSPIEEANIVLTTDPDVEGYQWVTLDINVRGDVEQVLENYNQFSTDVLKEISPLEREHFRLSLNIV